MKRKAQGVQDFQFHIGDFVLKRNTSNIGRKGGKLDNLWSGPYKYDHLFEIVLSVI